MADPLTSLLDRVSEAFRLCRSTVTLCLEEKQFEEWEESLSLRELGVAEGSVLTVIQKSMWKEKRPGLFEFRLPEATYDFPQFRRSDVEPHHPSPVVVFTKGILDDNDKDHYDVNDDGNLGDAHPTEDHAHVRDEDGCVKSRPPRWGGMFHKAWIDPESGLLLLDTWVVVPPQGQGPPYRAIFSRDDGKELYFDLDKRKVLAMRCMACLLRKKNLLLMLSLQEGPQVPKVVDCDPVAASFDADGSRVVVVNRTGRVEVRLVAAFHEAELLFNVEAGMVTSLVFLDGHVLLASSIRHSLLIWSSTSDGWACTHCIGDGQQGTFTAESPRLSFPKIFPGSNTAFLQSGSDLYSIDAGGSMLWQSRVRDEDFLHRRDFGSPDPRTGEVLGVHGGFVYRMIFRCGYVLPLFRRRRFGEASTDPKGYQFDDDYAYADEDEAIRKGKGKGKGKGEVLLPKDPPDASSDDSDDGGKGKGKGSKGQGWPAGGPSDDAGDDSYEGDKGKGSQGKGH